jgi:hypothetical protein
MYLENKNGKFVMHQLPNLAQISSINQILVDDYDNDQNLDIIIAGNLLGSEVETPRNDASNGLFLKGDGHGGFEPVTGNQSGLFAPGDVKDMVTIVIQGTEFIIVGKNNDRIQFIRIKKNMYKKTPSNQTRP